MKKKTLKGLTTGLFLFALTSSANAAPVTYEFSGVIQSANFSDISTSILSGISVNDSFTGFFTYDPETITLVPDSTINVNSYEHNPPLGELGFSVDIAGQAYKTSNNDSIHISIFNYVPPGVSGDRLDFYSTLSAFAPEHEVGLHIELVDSSSNIFSDANLPSFIDLLAFDSKEFNIIDCYGFESYGKVEGIVTSIKIKPVPVPATMLLFGTGIAESEGKRNSSHEGRGIGNVPFPLIQYQAEGCNHDRDGSSSVCFVGAPVLGAGPPFNGRQVGVILVYRTV